MAILFHDVPEPLLEYLINKHLPNDLHCVAH